MEFLIAFLSLLSLASAQFGFFDQMFGGHDGGHEHHQHHHHQQQQQQNNPSDASHYKLQFEQSICDKYLCPDTLACVHFPHHCPCAWDANEDKFEMGEGKRICISKGGFKSGEAARKIELARKGLL
ncbi:Long chronological lifespan protein 2 [Epichloe festucae Fl1]|uniref:Long chronological lifespan protein 2 n=1 Tax=Epichloe festucae (strain Fl1) TaxID=877507 RepID=A0A7S9KU24_EPIFF|nr:Long chronological lifespan protein 2 [Epichloe festucae Fl1]